MQTLFTSLSPGEIILADRLFDSYFALAYFCENGIDAVIRMKAARNEYLAKPSGVFKLSKPRGKPEWMSQSEFHQLPKFLLLRIVWKNKLAILTTLTDEAKYSDRKILSLYKERWNVEVDLRAIKSIMQMDILRCKTPEMIRKEIWAHMLAYNIVRSVMSAAAKRHRLPPRYLSLKTTLQILTASLSLARKFTLKMELQLYETMAQHLVGQRPGRREPRAIKRRPKITIC